MKETVLKAFESKFGPAKDAKVYFAPGRVNLIGEHTDYNGGHVFPCALTLGTCAAVRKRNDRVLRFYSENFKSLGVLESSLDELTPVTDEFKEKFGKDAAWIDYPKGVMWAFEKRGLKIPFGMDVAFWGNIPNGSGLSSSASLEVLTGYLLKDLFDIEVSNVDLALIGQYSENNFNGMNCGIMDQFASAMGKKDNAIFLDTGTLEFEYAPIALKGMKIVVTNSCVKHSLVGSAYNDRRTSCEKALKELKEVVDISALGDLSEEEFEKYKTAIKDEDRVLKAKHAVYENQRTIKAVEALKNNDLKEFGKLMNESHISLRDDYEVSCPEIDVLVDAAWKVDGVVGSRITGGGFGGCTVSIVKDGSLEEFKKVLTDEYKNKFNLTPEFYVVEIGDGPRML